MRFDLKGFVLKLEEFPDAIHSTSRFSSFQTGKGAARLGMGPEGEVLIDPLTTLFPLQIFLPQETSPVWLQQVSASG